jgi:tetratricopeptide (TPR) repeat protein
MYMKMIHKNISRQCLRKLQLSIMCIACAVFLAGCGANSKYLRRIQQFEEGVQNPSTVEELKDAIRKYQSRVEDVINAETQVGQWYRILAVRYIENEMYDKALETLEQAISYYPANHNLYYYVGVSAGYMAKASLDFQAQGTTSERDRYFALAESAYLRSVELNPRFTRGLYGLAILYVYELDRPEAAIPLLVQALDADAGNTEIMFVLATAYYLTGAYEESVAVYDKIIQITPSDEKKRNAEENKKFVLDAMYE